MDEEKDISSGLNRSADSGSLSIDDFQKAFGEKFAEAIDINTWSLGANLSELYPIIESEWLQAKTDESKNHKIFREVVFPRVKEKRSEEHTSELQSLTNLVCRLLLEKKKKKKKKIATINKRYV